MWIQDYINAHYEKIIKSFKMPSDVVHDLLIDFYLRTQNSNAEEPPESGKLYYIKCCVLNDYKRSKGKSKKAEWVDIDTLKDKLSDEDSENEISQMIDKIDLNLYEKITDESARAVFLLYTQKKWAVRKIANYYNINRNKVYNYIRISKLQLKKHLTENE